MSMIWSSRERNRSCSLVSRRSRGRIANPRSINSSEKNHGLRFEGILKIDLQGNRPQRPKTGKFDNLSVPNHPANSMAIEFFTDDYLAVVWRNVELDDNIRQSSHRLQYRRDGHHSVRARFHRPEHS